MTIEDMKAYIASRTAAGQLVYAGKMKFLLRLAEKRNAEGIRWTVKHV
jgi:hypothetical protein